MRVSASRLVAKSCSSLTRSRKREREIHEALLSGAAHKKGKYFFRPPLPPLLPHTLGRACVISSLHGILRVSLRVVTRLSPPPACSNYLPTFPHLSFPPGRRNRAARANPTLSGRNSSTLRVTVALDRSVGWLVGLPTSLDSVAESGGFAFLGLYRKHAHEPCIKPGGRAGPSERGSKVVWFHVRRVQRLPSLHATHEIPKVRVSRVSRGDALLTVCRDASYFSRFPLFFSLPFCPFSSLSASVANYAAGMRNVRRRTRER